MNTFNFNNSCRCCLDTNMDESLLLNMIETYLFDETKAPFQNVLLAESYFTLAGIDRNLEYEALKICKNCKTLLQSSYSFRELCRKSNNLIMQMHVKEEPIDLGFEIDENAVNIFCEEIRVPDKKPDVKEEEEGGVVDVEETTEKKHKEKKHKKRRESYSDDDGDDKSSDEEEYDSPPVKVKKEPKSSSSKSKSKSKKKKKRRRSFSDNENGDFPIKMVKTELRRDDSDEPVVKLHESGQNQIDYIEAQYNCMTCDKACKNYAMLIKHRQVHPNKGGVQVKRNCNICDEHQIPQNEFEQHCMDAHPEYKPQKCLLCSARFVGHKLLKEHLRKHLVPEKFQCLYCGSYHRTGPALRTHILKSCGDPNAYNCHICGLRFENIVPMNEHVREKHKVEFRSRYFPCHNCKRIYSSSKGYRAGCKACQAFKKNYDAEQVAKGLEPINCCKQCDAKFHVKEELHCHEIGKHQSGCYCFVCETIFQTAPELRAHNKEAHPREKKHTTYMCDECGKFWKDRFRLREHMRTHLPNPERPAKCHKCPATFMNNKHLSRHLRQAHNKKFLYECNECGKKSDTYAYLKIHLARAHFPHLKRFQCPYCPWSFASTYDRKRHMEIHTGERVLKIPQKKRNTLSDMRWQRSITRAKNPEEEMSAYYPLLVAEQPLEPANVAEFIQHQMYEGNLVANKQW